MSRCLFPRLLPGIFFKVKFYSRKSSFPGLPGARNMGMEETIVPGPNFNRPVKDLVYKDLLTSTFTQSSHDRGIKTWCVSVSYPQCVFCGNKFRYETCNVKCHMDPNIGKATTGKEGTVTVCKESLPTSRGPHRNRFLTVQVEVCAWSTTKKLCLQKMHRQNAT